jgi:multimeric flavodoxin WrbA
VAKLVILIGSPRANGNSATLARAAEQAALEEGATVERIMLHGLDIGPCDGCGSCRTSVDASCILDDDMTLVYEKLRQADSILIATPIYSYDMAAQTKLLVDRLYALGSREDNALTGKRFGFLIVYGAANPFSAGASTAMRCFHDTFARKASWMRIVHGSTPSAESAASSEELLTAAARLGAELAAPAAPGKH